MMPAQFTPKIVYLTHTGVGPYVRLESTFTVLSHLELGAYFSFSDHPVSQVGDNMDVAGGVVLVSGGALAKLRFDPASWAAVRIGLSVGGNYAAFPLQTGAGQSETMPSRGLQVGLDADFRAMLTARWGIVTKLGFLAQPVGESKFPDDSDWPGRTVFFGFPPAVFLGVGPEVVF
jgi:hypothetical protein